MEIAHAFLTENIQAADVGLDQEEIDELRAFVSDIVGTEIREQQQDRLEGEQINAAAIWLDAVTHAFVAGRCYQQEIIDDQGGAPIRVEMTPGMAERYIQWLSDQS